MDPQLNRTRGTVVFLLMLLCISDDWAKIKNMTVNNDLIQCLNVKNAMIFYNIIVHNVEM